MNASMGTGIGKKRCDYRAVNWSGIAADRGQYFNTAEDAKW